ncbi:putative membrane protein required for colicin V production [Agromyces sp. 3263]|uniref:MarP family serine protease n=1 Tax=Agromyces sp. 3263 TaxID=2817750 RepID=UPI0028592857|nr:MarP family serine protease [Agromyces sp. 3263]MDR6906824.1 putative membrane protein required for colicin V production [Agromyces sp. 3263]
MGWSLLLDVLLVLAFIAAAVHGYRAGLLRTAAGLIGLVLGGLAAYLVMPWVSGLVPAPEWRAPAAIGTALVLLSLGAWLGAVVGRALRRGAQAVKLGVLDRVLGAIGNLLVAAFVVALVASGVSAMGVPVLSPAIAGSRVLTTLDQVTPAPTRTLLAEIRTAALGQGIPWLVQVLDAPTEAPELPSGGVDDAELARAATSVVRVTGTAFQCGSNLSGSGFVVADDRIVTNAHVVAGVTEPIVEAPGQPALAGRVVAFDQENDLAVIAVSGLLTPPLPIDDLATGSDAAVAGYPFGGPLELRPARVMSVGPITIEESGRTSTREIMTVAADVDHGNSGGPVLTGDGAVGGVVFAKSDSVENVGYAIPVSTLSPLAEQAPLLDDAVDSGSCAD